MIGIIDCGTTNTRVYIVDGEKILGSGEEKVGVKDTVINHGDNTILKEGIKKAFHKAIKNVGLASVNELEYAVASGMITSEIGLIDVPHLIAPAGVKDLAENVSEISDNKIFPFDIPIIFIRGVKNDYGKNAKVNDIRAIDFMRGEEVQVLGIVEDIKPQLPVNIMFLSSHTKIVHINKNGEIGGSITTISGQFYESLKSTFIAKCIENSDNATDLEDYGYEEMADIAYDCVNNCGLLRTMLMPRFMQNLLKTNSVERKLFVNGAIAADDIKIIDEFARQGYDTKTDYILVGHENRCKLYSYYINKYVSSKNEVYSISDKNQIDYATVRGVLEVLKARNTK
jgi:2-dehydro-3-deoxygalactonokinase